MSKSKVLKNVVTLRGYLQSMDCAISKAERGSAAEDMYFMEKLDKMCTCMNRIPIQRVHTNED